VSDDSDAVGKAFAIVNRYLERRLNRPFTSPPLWMPTLANFRFNRAIRTLNEIVRAIIQQRRQPGQGSAAATDHADLLSILMHTRDEETGKAMGDDQLRSEVLAFFIAGHETTATALTWTWYLLATHPRIRQRVREEAVSVL